MGTDTINSEQSHEAEILGATRRLKLILLAGDAAAILAGFLAVLCFSNYINVHGWASVLVIVAFATFAGLWSLRLQGLFLARISAVRVVEITRTARAMMILAAASLAFDRIVKMDLHVRYVVTASALSFVLVCVNRSGYRGWLRLAREQGQHCRTIAIIGTDDEAARLFDLFNTHGDAGLAVAGVIGDPKLAATSGLRSAWLGDIDKTEALVEYFDVSGVVISPSQIPASRLNEIVRNLHDAGRHVHIATGISGIDASRFRALPLAHEPLLYVEARSLSRIQIDVKRCFDIVMSAVALVILSPVLLAVAIAVRAGDGGPIIFTQRRVGQDGVTFDVLKFRTMAVDAEQRLSELGSSNERHGPLFKMEIDPRVTRVGRFLRSSSLDELPQLLNVLKGEMSLVGPRPALPSEVAQFSDELRMRENVLPGITGLWQVEARDNPSFEAYSRLDLFYVENWSITLDLIIILGTVEQIVLRVLSSIFRTRADKPAVLPASHELVSSPDRA